MRSIVAATFHTSTFSSQATPAQWTIDSIRTGVIAKKKGMTSIWSETGVRLPVTVLQVKNDKILSQIGKELCINIF